MYISRFTCHHQAVGLGSVVELEKSTTLMIKLQVTAIKKAFCLVSTKLGRRYCKTKHNGWLFLGAVYNPTSYKIQSSVAF